MRCLLASPMNSGNVAVPVYGWAYCVIWHVLRNFIKGICLCAWEERTLHRWCVIHGPSVTQDAPPWGGTAITYNHAQVCWLVKPLYIDLRSAAGVCIAGGVSPLSIWLHNLCIWALIKCSVSLSQATNWLLHTMEPWSIEPMWAEEPHRLFIRNRTTTYCLIKMENEIVLYWAHKHIFL